MIKNSTKKASEASDFTRQAITGCFTNYYNTYNDKFNNRLEVFAWNY